MSTPRKVKSVPTHTQLTELISTLLPPHPRDVSTIYHEPRYPGYNPATTPVHDVVLSITPTPGVYTKLASLASSRSRPLKPACFLHRPFNLDRRAVPRGSLIHASHKRFDELLTTGWNVPLADRLGLDIENAKCLQGYKQDPERRIGLVAKLREPCSVKDLHSLVMKEFGAGIVAPEDAEIDVEGRIDAVAIMNAFGAEEVIRAVVCATEAGFIADGGHAKLLYLTGEPKELGLAALKETYTGMTAICVGHRPAEEWGISYLGTYLKKRWEDLHIHLVFEDEEPPPPREPHKEQHSGEQVAANDLAAK